MKAISELRVIACVSYLIPFKERKKSFTLKSYISKTGERGERGEWMEGGR